MRPRKTTFVINDSTCGGLKSLTIKTINVRNKGFAGDVFTLARVKTPQSRLHCFSKRGNAYSRLWVLACFLFWTVSPSMLYPAVSSSIIFRMLLSIFAKSRHVSFKVLNCEETAWAERASAKIRVSFFCFSLFRDYPSSQLRRWHCF